MTQNEFSKFQKDSGHVYATQLMSANQLSREAAEERARVEGEKILPAGINTKGAVLLSIFKSTEQIGYLWFMLKDRGQLKTAFTYAFEIYPHAKGHGYTAMLKAREYLREIGVQKVALHVFSKNDRAVELFKAVGFQTESYNMSIELS